MEGGVRRSEGKGAGSAHREEVYISYSVSAYVCMYVCMYVCV